MLKTVFPVSNYLDTLVEIQLTLNVKVSQFYFIIVALWYVLKLESMSSPAVFFQDCFGYCHPLAFPCELHDWRGGCPFLIVFLSFVYVWSREKVVMHTYSSILTGSL